MYCVPGGDLECAPEPEAGGKLKHLLTGAEVALRWKKQVPKLAMPDGSTTLKPLQGRVMALSTTSAGLRATLSGQREGPTPTTKGKAKDTIEEKKTTY